MAWYDEAIFYHIYPLGLSGAPKQNSYGEPEHRLRGLFPWIDHIKAIGCNAIYIGPLFESVGHGYETTDYYRLDSRLGDNQDLKDFVSECHSKGMHVIFDGVFNHVGRDFFAFKDLQQNRENSRYRDWFCNVNFWGNNEYNDGFSYENWGGYNLLVKLNQRNPEVRDYICDVIRFWVREFDVDGLRLDAADVLDFDFMKTLRWLAGEVKPDFWLMGEVIHGEYTRWANDGTLHSVTNYHLHKALFSGHNEHNYFEIAHTVKRLYGMGGNRPDGLKLYNFVDNHDVERIYTKLSNKANFFPVHVLLYTLPGIPSIYYGSEFGIEGHKYRGGGDDEIRPYLNLQDFTGAEENNPCTGLIRALGMIRQHTPALSYGDYREVALTTKQYTFTRTMQDMTVIVTVNNDENECDINAGNLPDGWYTGALSGEKVHVEWGNFHAHLHANSGEIWIPSGYSDDKAAQDFREIAEKAEAERLEKARAEEEKRRAAEERRIRAAEERRAVEERRIRAADRAAGEYRTADGGRAAEAGRAAGECRTADGGRAAEADRIRETAEYGLTYENAPETGIAPDFYSAADKYGLGEEYSSIDPDDIARRSDYDRMTMQELQVAILEKMAKNGPVNDQMKKTVTDNVYLNSLQNWVKSFR